MVNGLTVTGNTVTNPGSTGQSISSQNLSAIEVLNSVQNASIQSNNFIDNRTTAVMLQGIAEATNNLGSDVYGTNTMQISSVRHGPSARTGIRAFWPSVDTNRSTYVSNTIRTDAAILHSRC